jgi:hypothetical protein
MTIQDKTTATIEEAALATTQPTEIDSGGTFNAQQFNP